MATTGCATRTVRHSFVDRGDVRIDFVREVKGFSKVQPRGYQHPAIISAERMQHILRAIEIETRDDSSAVVRQPAFHPDLIEKTATQLVAAFAEAGPDQELGVKIVRKAARIGILHRKYLTSFITYVEDGYLYVLLSRVDWQIPKNKEDDPLPEPIRGKAPMQFRVVTGEHLFYAGTQALEIAWQDPVFRNPYRLPGSTSGERRRREILDQSDVPKEEIDEQLGNEPGIGIEDLSADQLRALADLEDDRREGRITEAAYQRARRQLLRKR
jgi:hypothetical protein